MPELKVEDSSLTRKLIVLATFLLAYDEGAYCAAKKAGSNAPRSALVLLAQPSCYMMDGPFSQENASLEECVYSSAPGVFITTGKLHKLIGAMDNTKDSIVSSVQLYMKKTGQVEKVHNQERDPEADRLEIQHQLFHITLGGRLHLSPLSDNINSVLDIATGDATWALAFADKNPTVSIIANSSSIMDKTGLPANITPDTADAGKPWPYSQKFDYIHCRQNHRRLEEHGLFAQSLEFLNAGGWLEMQELCNPPTCDDGTLTEDNPLYKWGRLLVDASEKMNRPTDNPKKYEAWMKEAGFTNCQTVVHRWPTNPWPEDEEGKLVGQWNSYNVLQRFEEFSTALMVKALGWNPEDARDFLVAVREQLQNPDVHAYWPVYFVYGQKPPIV